MAPFITARNMACPDIIPTLLQAAGELSRRGVGFLHLAEADWDDAPQVPEDFRHALRAAYGGRIIVAGGYDAARARSLLASGLVDLVAFGRAFIANPDLPARLAQGLTLAGFDGEALFGGTAAGYSDYPAAAEAPAAVPA
jgi:N-ethylmaleimide reductase